MVSLKYKFDFLQWAEPSCVLWNVKGHLEFIIDSNFYGFPTNYVTHAKHIQEHNGFFLYFLFSLISDKNLKPNYNQKLNEDNNFKVFDKSFETKLLMNYTNTHNYE